MYCSRCGYQNEQGAAYCSKCGAPAEQFGQPVQTPSSPVPPQSMAQGMTQSYGPQVYAPQPGYPPAAMSTPPKKKRTGLIIGLVAGGVVLIGTVVAVWLLFLSGPGIDGIWSCEGRGWVLQIDDGILTEYSPAGTDTSRYTYAGGSGEALLQDGRISFVLKGDRLGVTDKNTGDKYLFTRQDQRFDIEEAVLAGIGGLWSSEVLGEVIELNDGILYVYSGAGDFTGSYEYDVQRGEGMLSLVGDEYAFAAGWDTLSVDTIGTYTRGENGLDVAAFVSRFANPLLATWYETMGTYGAITFAADGSFTLDVYGVSLAGTYTFDPQTGSGTVVLEKTGEAEPFTYADGTLTLDGAAFTQNYVEQPGADDLNAAVKGIWYNAEASEEMIMFYTDNTVEVIGEDTFYSGAYTFDPYELSGVITLTDGVQSEDYDFYLSGDMLYVSDYAYTRQSMAADTGLILGTWYDVNGMQGTLYFDKDGLAFMDSYGTMFYGTYTFDESAGTGSMTLDFVEGLNTWSLKLEDILLYLDDGTVYTQQVVEQTTSTDAG